MKNVHCNIMATTSGRRYEADCWITWHKTKHIGSKSGGLRLPRPTVPCKNEVGPQSGRKRVLPGQSDWVDFTSNHPDLCVGAARRIISKFDRISCSSDSSDSDW